MKTQIPYRKCKKNTKQMERSCKKKGNLTGGGTLAEPREERSELLPSLPDMCTTFQLKGRVEQCSKCAVITYHRRISEMVLQF